jgi:hypothetical protein
MIKAIPYQSVWLGMSLWLLVTSGLLGWGGWQTYENHLFADHARPVTGTVIDRGVSVSHGRGGTTYHYSLAYNYQADNLGVTCRTSVLGSTYGAFAIGDPIPLLYLPEKPSDSRINALAEDESLRNKAFMVCALGLIALVAGAGISSYVIWRNKINRRLIATGLSCEGRVTSVDWDLVGKQQTMAYYLVFIFRDNRGQEIMGKTWHLRPGEENAWREGQPIQVYYDTTRPECFTVDLNSDRYSSNN